MAEIKPQRYRVGDIVLYRKNLLTGFLLRHEVVAVYPGEINTYYDLRQISLKYKLIMDVREDCILPSNIHNE
jgi:hypothetical protein